MAFDTRRVPLTQAHFSASFRPGQGWEGPSAGAFCELLQACVIICDMSEDLKHILANISHEDIVREKCERSFHEFVKHAFGVLEPGVTMDDNWHIQAICEHLEAVNRGEVQRLLINVPPRTMKSLLVNVMWPVWSWIHRPHLKVISISYSHELSVGLSVNARQLVKSDWFTRLWPHVKLNEDQDAKHFFATTQGGFRYCTSTRGTLTGKGADLLIVDDPHDPSGAESDLERQRAIRWWRETASTRLNDFRTGAIVNVQQRLHAEDLAGHMLESGNYDHLNLPMRFEEDRKAKTSIGWEDPRTEEGELLWPERFTESVVDELENSMGGYAFAGQMQQRPVPREGGLFKTESLRYLDYLPADPIAIVRAYDKAGTEGGGKRTAGVKMAVLPKNNLGIRYVIMDVVKGQYSIAQREQIIKETAINDGHDVKIYIEQEPGSAGKESALNTVANLEGFSVHRDRPSGEKTVRAEPLATQIEIGAVAVLNRPWVDAFVDELSTFPNGKYLDQCDAAALAFNKLSREAMFQEKDEPIQPAIQVVK
jgi:predicted phage terminase large subunit-like protein